MIIQQQGKEGGRVLQKKIFQVLDFCVWNSFVLYQKNGGQKTNLEFRKNLIEMIIETFNAPNPKNGRPSYEPSPLRPTERHFPEHIPNT